MTMTLPATHPTCTPPLLHCFQHCCSPVVTPLAHSLARHCQAASSSGHGSRLPLTPAARHPPLLRCRAAGAGARHHHLCLCHRPGGAAADIEERDAEEGSWQQLGLAGGKVAGRLRRKEESGVRERVTLLPFQGQEGIEREVVDSRTGCTCAASGPPTRALRPSVPPCLPQDVQLQNAGAWANLTAAPAGGADAAADAAAGGAAPAEDDNLWTEFQGREAQQLQVGRGVRGVRPALHEQRPARGVPRFLHIDAQAEWRCARAHVLCSQCCGWRSHRCGWRHHRCGRRSCCCCPCCRSCSACAALHADVCLLPLPPLLLQAEEAKKAAEEAERKRKQEEMETMRRDAAEVGGAAGLCCMYTEEGGCCGGAGGSVALGCEVRRLLQGWLQTGRGGGRHAVLPVVLPGCAAAALLLSCFPCGPSLFTHRRKLARRQRQRPRWRRSGARWRSSGSARRSSSRWALRQAVAGVRGGAGGVLQAARRTCAPPAARRHGPASCLASCSASSCLLPPLPQNLAAEAAAAKDPDILAGAAGGGHDSAANLADLGLQVRRTDRQTTTWALRACSACLSACCVPGCGAWSACLAAPRRSRPARRPLSCAAAAASRSHRPWLRLPWHCCVRCRPRMRAARTRTSPWKTFRRPAAALARAALAPAPPPPPRRPTLRLSCSMQRGGGAA